MDMVLIIQRLHSPFYAPQFVAMHLGLLVEEGVQVAVHTVSSGLELRHQLLSGAMDLGLSGPLWSLELAEEGRPERLVSVIEMNSRDGFFLVGHAAHPPFAWRDLVGRRLIRFAEVPTPWLCLQHVLRRVGVAIQTVHVRGDLDTAAAVPTLTHLGGLFGTESPGAAIEEHALLAATRALGITLHPIHDPLRTRSSSTLKQLFAKIIQEPLDALWVPGALTVFHQEIAAFAVQKGLPTIGWNGFVDRGGLMTYETFGSARVVATYVDRILKGAQPAELPIERPFCCKLVINLKTAKALRITLPPTFLFQANEVMQ